MLPMHMTYHALSYPYVLCALCDIGVINGTQDVVPSTRRSNLKMWIKSQLGTGI